MASMNRATLIGHLGRDAELRYTQGGTAVASLNVATSERWKGKDGELNQKTEWHKVTVWNKLAEFAGKLQKGSQVAIEGRIETRKWQDKAGNDRYTTEIVANSVLALGPKPGERVVKGDHQEAPPAEEEDGGEQIPF
jgi:single-strand DNA-binding protein